MKTINYSKNEQSEELDSVLGRMPRSISFIGTLSIFLIIITMAFVAYFVNHVEVVAGELTIYSKIMPRPVVAFRVFRTGKN